MSSVQFLRYPSRNPLLCSEAKPPMGRSEETSQLSAAIEAVAIAVAKQQDRLGNLNDMTIDVDSPVISEHSTWMHGAFEAAYLTAAGRLVQARANLKGGSEVYEAEVLKVLMRYGYSVKRIKEAAVSLRWTREWTAHSPGDIIHRYMVEGFIPNEAALSIIADVENFEADLH